MFHHKKVRASEWWVRCCLESWRVTSCKLCHFWPFVRPYDSGNGRLISKSSLRFTSKWLCRVSKKGMIWHKTVPCGSNKPSKRKVDVCAPNMERPERPSTAIHFFFCSCGSIFLKSLDQRSNCNGLILRRADSAQDLTFEWLSMASFALWTNGLSLGISGQLNESIVRTFCLPGLFQGKLPGEFAKILKRSTALKH